MPEQFKFDYGQTVQIAPSAPSELQPGALGAVVGMGRIETEKRAMRLGYPVGTILYTVEYPEGYDKEVPEEFLILVYDEFTNPPKD